MRGLDAPGHAAHCCIPTWRLMEVPARRAPDGHVHQHGGRPFDVLRGRKEIFSPESRRLQRWLIAGPQHRGYAYAIRSAGRSTRPTTSPTRELPEPAVPHDRVEVTRCSSAQWVLFILRRPRAELQHDHDAHHRQLACRSPRAGGARRLSRPSARRRNGPCSRCCTRSDRSATSRRSSSASRRAKAAS